MGVQPRGSIASDNLIHKLCALQDFMHDINWPDLEFRDHLDQRLKLLAADMIEQAVRKLVNFTQVIQGALVVREKLIFRTKMHFDNHIAKGGTGTGYLIPNSICVMINCLLDCDEKVSFSNFTKVQTKSYSFEAIPLGNSTLVVLV